MKHAISRKQAALVGTTALVGAAALWPSVAGADPAGPGRAQVIVGPFTSDRTQEAFINHDADPLPTLGDELVYTNSSWGVLGRATDYGRCTLHEVQLTPAPAMATFVCTAVTRLGRDSITYQGSLRATLAPAGQPPQLLEASSWAVTGGTGRFLRARGDILITSFEGAGRAFSSSGRTRLVLAP